MILAAQKLRRTTTITAMRMPAYTTSAIRDSSHAMKVPLVQRGRLHNHVSHFVAKQQCAKSASHCIRSKGSVDAQNNAHWVWCRSGNMLTCSTV
jgi:hypothetical protein